MSPTDDRGVATAPVNQSYISNLTWKDNGRTIHSPGSNFWTCEDGFNVEVEFQARKFIVAGKPFWAKIVKSVGYPSSPGKAKKQGREFRLSAEQIRAWDSVKLEVMRELIAEKFRRSEGFRAWLLETESRLIIESNWWHDGFWGDCLCNNSDGKHPQCLKHGTNWLGHILMDQRGLLRR